MFTNISGESVKVVHSHYNELQQEKEHQRRFAEFAARSGVRLSTMDAVQGCEKEVVVILTSKTNFDPKGAEFLDDRRRINASLEQLPFWGKVLQWSNDPNAVIPSTSQPRTFKKR
ncbi:unnamed protein product [Cylicostephanus goldi]|uniref:DNA2/NAM7 helicase-like C-terminal domain-containing protein n=1 Tax=Cylicostephanus goldi TaxID=71465 RepID=A0A3P7MEU3_CYLGO|nr:unnamed protein product [Cylicostephanus goldi]